MGKGRGGGVGHGCLKFRSTSHLCGCTLLLQVCVVIFVLLLSCFEVVLLAVGS